MGFVQDVAGKNNFLFQFEDGQNKEISASLLVFLRSKDEVEIYEPLSYSPKK